MKAADLRQLSSEDLATRLEAAQRELYELRFKAVVGQLENPHQIGLTRKLIARILTVSSEPPHLPSPTGGEESMVKDDSDE